MSGADRFYFRLTKGIFRGIALLSSVGAAALLMVFYIKFEYLSDLGLSVWRHDGGVGTVVKFLVVIVVSAIVGWWEE
jgi:hypothetical protein